MKKQTFKIIFDKIKGKDFEDIYQNASDYPGDFAKEIDEIKELRRIVTETKNQETFTYTSC